MSLRARFALVSGGLLAAALPATALAHGTEAPKPDLWILLTRWEFDPLFIVLMGLSSWLYISGVRRVKANHPKSPFPRRRIAFFFAGIGTLILALVSPPASYDTTFFSLHMWQHLLLTMVAAPLLILGTPVTLALRAAPPRLRKEVLLPILHSRGLRVITFPVLSWVLFAAVMWGSHFSPIYEASLENAWIHRLEHFFFITAALMFWWQAIGADPTPWRMNHPVRLLYVFLQMPQNSFLAVSIYSADYVLYSHYETLVRTWGPSPLTDQQIAGVSMWIGGDMMFLAACAYIIYGWVKHEDREADRQDRALAREKAERARAPSTSP